MRKAYAVAAVAVAVAALLISFALLGSMNDSQTDYSPLDPPSVPVRGFFMGVLPSPYEGQAFEDAYVQVAEHADFVPVWGKPSAFYNMASDLEGSWGDTFVTEYTRGNGMFPLIHFSFISTGMTLAKPPGMEDATLSDPAWREAYMDAIIDTVKVIRPRYLSVGNEVNRWYEAHGAEDGDPMGFQHFVSLYEEVYDAVKELSNETQVFCVFAREIVSEYREADLNVLDMFDPEKMDLLMFTSYPYAVQGINKPNDVPQDYYSAVLEHMPGKLFGFTEVSWPSIDVLGGLQGQADFLGNLSGALTVDRGVDLHMLGWVWLHDLDDEDESGMIERDGTPKPVYSVWMELSASL